MGALVIAIPTNGTLNTLEGPRLHGHSVREKGMEPLVTEAVRVPWVAPHILSRLLNGHAANTPEMAKGIEDRDSAPLRDTAAPGYDPRYRC